MVTKPMEGTRLAKLENVRLSSLVFSSHLLRLCTGAKKSGAKGFFKGVGKGLVGVVAKPVSGVVDFASSTLEGIKG